ncbi:MAG: hypothetical protein J2P48_03575 [Alphaproteobacteria bacterium]|nr:hypothetical protein [Alphaproteobacteria bacterium]
MTMYFAACRVWDRLCNAPWQRFFRQGLVPAVMGLVIASGAVMAGAADTSWRALAVTIAAAGIMLLTRLNPMWMLLTGAALGGFGLHYTPLMTPPIKGGCGPPKVDSVSR